MWRPFCARLTVQIESQNGVRGRVASKVVEQDKAGNFVTPGPCHPSHMLVTIVTPSFPAFGSNAAPLDSPVIPKVSIIFPFMQKTFMTHAMC